MSETGFTPRAYVQVPPRTPWTVEGPLRAPSTPKCASRLRLPRIPPAITMTTSPMSIAALMPDRCLILCRMGIVGCRGAGTTAEDGAAAALSGGSWPGAGVRSLDWPCGVSIAVGDGDAAVEAANLG